jgi:predicted HTH domain antitoxin
METVDLKVPSELLKAANIEGESPSEEAARLLALELYREGKVSLGRAADLCQTSLAAFMDFAARHGVSTLRSNAEELEQESRTLSGIANCPRQGDANHNDFRPIEISGEPLSATILRDRR